MRRPRTRSAARLAGASLLFVLACASVASAGSPGSLRQQVTALQARTHHAVLDLYALDSQLRSAQSRLLSLQAQAASLRQEQQLLALQISATRQTLQVSQSELGANLSTLYKRGDVSVLAVVLGSKSLDAAVTELDDLTRVTDETQQVVRVTRSAQSRLGRLQATLAAHRAEIDAAVAAAQRTETQLAAARSDRVAFIAHLRNEAKLKTAQIRALEATAQRVVEKSVLIQAAAAPTASVAADPPAAPVPVASGDRTITVTSTGYSLPGHTATGLPVGWGVVAVDPGVIPLGTRLTIPGYGEGVAADTGSSVRGDTIDLWFPTLAQARAWGRRTVTITLH